LAAIWDLAHGFELFGGLEGAVGGTVGEEDFDVLAIDFGALGLAVGAVGTTDVGAFVPGEADPLEGVEDHLLGGGDEAGAVGVFDAEDELAVALARKDVVEEADVGGANVGVAGGRGGDADADGTGVGCGGGCVCHKSSRLMLTEPLRCTCALSEVVGVEGGELAAEDGDFAGFGDGGEGGVDLGVVGKLGFEGQLLVLVGEIDGFEQDDDVSDCRSILGEAFGGLALDADVVDVDAEEVGDALAHLSRERDDLGAVHDEDAVDVDDLEADEGDFFERGFEENGGVGALPLGVGGGEEGADVSGGYGSEEGVGDGVEEEIAVGVAGEALGMVDAQTTDDEGYAFLEGVGVEAEADAHTHC